MNLSTLTTKFLLQVAVGLLLFKLFDANASVVFEDHFVATLSNGARAVSSADMDGDGDIDLLVASGMPGNSRISWFENDGDSNFIAHRIGNGGGNNVGPQSVLGIDIDSDGDKDVLVASEENHKIIWYENKRPPNNSLLHFTEHVVADNAISARAASGADLDGDGDIDLFSAARGGGVSWYENDGAQSFTEHVITADHNRQPTSITSSDIDGDGDLDLVVAFSGRWSVVWYENTDGKFRQGSDFEHLISNQFRGPHFVETVDQDDDGDKDVLSVNKWDNTVVWHVNNGNGQFEDIIIPSNGVFPVSVGSGDIDGDGDLDLFSGSQFDKVGPKTQGKLSWHENLGDGIFINHSFPSSGLRPQNVSSADVDMDGDIDLLVGSVDGQVFWYENKSLITQSNKWNLIGLPCSPAASENTVADIFGDDVNGEIGSDWSIFRYTPDAGYESLAASDPVSQGEGYWFIQKNIGEQAVTIDLPESCGSTPVDQPEQCEAENGCYEIPLATTEGTTSWNLIGYPFDPRSQWDQLRIVADGACALGCTPAEAQTAGILHNDGWRFSSDADEYQPLSDGNLDRWYGLWVTTLEQAHGTSPRILVPKE